MKNIFRACCVLLLCATYAVQGQSVWTGSGGNARWSTAANWQGGAAPAPSPRTSLTFGGSVSNAQNDLLTGSSFSNLTIAAGASPFGLSGNGFGLYGTLVNSSSVQQRIANDLTWIGPNRNLDTGASGIALDGYLASGATNAYFNKIGSGTLTLNGGGLFTVNDTAIDHTFAPVASAGTVVITKDITFNRLDLKGGARLIVTNNATFDGFVGNYIFGRTAQWTCIAERSTCRVPCSRPKTGPRPATSMSAAAFLSETGDCAGPTTATRSSPSAAMANSNGCREPDFLRTAGRGSR